MNDPVHEKIRNLYVSQNLERHMLSHHQMPQRSIPPPVSTRAAVIVASAAYLYRAKETYRLLKRTISPNKRPVLAAQTGNTPKNVYGGNAARLLSRRRPTEPSAFTIAHTG